MMLETPEACANEEAVKAAVESVLGAEVCVSGRLPFGNVNEVFKVESGGRAYVVKVFRQANWPEAGKLPWVASRLIQQGVPHARLIHYTRDAKHFPHGFSVCEFVAGENCKGAIREGRLKPEAFCERAAALLRRVHAISVPRYGYIGDGRGMEEDFAGWLLSCEVFDNLRKVDDGSSLEETLRPRFEREVEPVLRRFESRFKPVLVHHDCTPKNGLLDSEGSFVFVDWDETVAGYWVMDYAALTYWYSYILKCTEPRDADAFRGAFFRGYGAVDFDLDELRALEWALHTTQAAGALSYLYTVGDERGCRRERELLMHMLDTSHAR